MYIKNNKYLFCNTKTIIGLLDNELTPDKIKDMEIFELTCTGQNGDGGVKFVSSDNQTYMNNPVQIKDQTFPEDFVHPENDRELSNVQIDKMFDYLRFRYETNNDERAFRIGVYLVNYIEEHHDIPELLGGHMNFFVD